jgi:hypothetical protein
VFLAYLCGKNLAKKTTLFKIAVQKTQQEGGRESPPILFPRGRAFFAAGRHFRLRERRRARSICPTGIGKVGANSKYYLVILCGQA